jgi:hypothetical protein
MTTDVLADATTLLRQAPMTISEYLSAVVTMLDDRFGEGYAEKHPDLVGVLVTACTRDFGTAFLKLAAQDLREALYALADAVREQAGKQ